jgi:hypothetical protein
LGDDVADLLGRRYICNKCNKASKKKKSPASGRHHTNLNDDDLDDSDDMSDTFNGEFSVWHPKLLMLLPAYIRLSFPFILTKRSGILYEVVQEVVDNLVSGKSSSASESFILQRHLKRYYSNRLIYLSRQKNQPLLLSSYKVDSFGSFYDLDRYNGHVPGAQYLSSLVEKYFQSHVYTSEGLPVGAENLTREQFLQRRQQTIRGRIWSADESYKLANLCYLKSSSTVPLSATSKDSASTRPITSIFTVFNEKREVVLQKFLTTTSRSELKTELKRLLHDRYRALGFRLPMIYYTDNCCKDAILLREVLDELAESDSLFSSAIHGPSPNTTTPLELVSLPANHQLYVVTFDNRQLLTYIEQIRETALDDGKLTFGDAGGLEKGIIGLDIEWDPCTLHGVTDTDPALLQLSTATTTILIRLRIENKKPRQLPSCILNLLLDKRIIFVGNYIKGDLTRLSNAYHFDTSAILFCDLSREAIRRNYNLESHSLSYLCRRFLQKELPKESKIRLSRWSQPQLSDDQVKYAALDAYISYEIFKAIQNGGDPRLDPPPSNTPCPGTRVLLFTQNKAECIAMGSIVDHQSPDFGGLLLFPSGRGKRVVVQLDPTSIYVGGALSQYPPRRGSSRLPLSECHLVLWDLDCIRPDSPSAQRWRESLEDTIGSIEDNIKTNGEDELTDIDSDDFFSKVSGSTTWVEVALSDDDTENGMRDVEELLADLVEEATFHADTTCNERNDAVVIVKGNSFIIPQPVTTY